MEQQISVAVARMGLILGMFLYSFGLVAALVASAPWWLWKMGTTHKYREGLPERLGRVPVRLSLAGDSRQIVWIHAVSVGEVIAVSGLVRELRARASDCRVVVSTTTLTGQKVARERFGAENVFYYPLDFAWAVRAYLRALQPRLFVLAETEFWPRMLRECRCAGLPVAVVNARISDRSYPKYLRLRGIWRRFLGGLALVLAQTEGDATRLRAIGVPAERVRVGGNLKYDVRAASDSGLVAAMRSALPSGAKVLVCGSTLEGEERILLEAWPGLVAAEPELRMVLAPRHPERFGAVAELLEHSGILWERRSAWGPALKAQVSSGEIRGAKAPRFHPSAAEAAEAEEAATNHFPGRSILLLDSIGELASVYSVAAVAFVGGSLVAAGGHNPLEPAQFGVPIVMGRHYENFREIVEKLRVRDGLRVVDVGDLSAVVLELLRDSISASGMGVRAAEVFVAEAGATERAVEALLGLLARQRQTGETA